MFPDPKVKTDRFLLRYTDRFPGRKPPGIRIFTVVQRGGACGLVGSSGLIAQEPTSARGVKILEGLMIRRP